jgi:hypothetical protein
LNEKIDEENIQHCQQTMSDPQDNRAAAEQVLYELWYSVAETLFQRVCDVTGLDEEQRDALRKVALRPNDFQIHIT